MSTLKWTKEALQVEALKYTRRIDFSRNSGGAYTTARNMKILNEICVHMATPPSFWNIFTIYNEALKFKTRGEFQKGSSAYQTAIRNNLLDKVCSHMSKPATAKKTNNEFIYTVIKEAPDYVTLEAYKGMNTKILFKHLTCNYEWKTAPSNFINNRSRCPRCMKGSDNDVVYLWQVDNTTTYKIGITSKRLGLKRIKQVAFAMNVKHTLLMYVETVKALEIENKILNMYVNCPLNIEATHESGRSEFRILTLDEVTQIIKLTYKEIR